MFYQTLDAFILRIRTCKPLHSLILCVGDPNDICTIFVDGKSVQITTSLESALRHLREKQPGRVLCLWADALCINQTDGFEKNQQVQQMGTIYATAHHTVIYLGSSTKQIDFAFEKLQVFQRRNPGPGPVRDVDGSSLEELQTIWHTLRTCVLTRPWFKRVWVFQELVLSHDPWLQCGNRRMRWDKFCEIFYALEKRCADMASHALGTIDVTANQEPDVFKPLRDMQTRRSAFHYTKQDEDDNHHNSLLDLLSLRRGLGASDSRDLVFAHLGLAADYRKDPKRLRVDYTLSCIQVFVEAARYMIEQGALHEVLDQATEVETRDRMPGLPSWAPDWTLAKFSRRAFPIQHADDIIKNRKAVWSFTPWSHIPMRLVCKGQYIGSIARLSKTLSYLKKPRNEVRSAWIDVLNNLNTYSAKSKEHPDERMSQKIYISLYNEWLQIFGSDLQHLRLPPGFQLPPKEWDIYDFNHCYAVSVLRSLKTYRYEDIRYHPIAAMSGLVLGQRRFLGNKHNQRESVLARVVDTVLSPDGNRLGIPDLDIKSSKSFEKKRTQTLDMEGIECFTQMPFGLYPNSAKESDRICMLAGCQSYMSVDLLKRARMRMMVNILLFLANAMSTAAVFGKVAATYKRFQKQILSFTNN